MKVDTLQTNVIDILCNKLTTYDLTEFCTKNFAQNIPKLILQQLCWIEHIIDPQNFTLQLIKVINNVPFNLQIDVIGLLPEIIEDSQHSVPH